MKGKEFDEKLFKLVDIPTDEAHPKLKKNLDEGMRINKKLTGLLDK